MKDYGLADWRVFIKRLGDDNNNNNSSNREKLNYVLNHTCLSPLEQILESFCKTAQFRTCYIISIY